MKPTYYKITHSTNSHTNSEPIEEPIELTEVLIVKTLRSFFFIAFTIGAMVLRDIPLQTAFCNSAGQLVGFRVKDLGFRVNGLGFRV